MESYALVTGASKGLGRDFCFLFAEKKINLVLTARDQQLLESLALELKNKYSISVETYSCDLSEEKHYSELCNWISKKNIQIDYLVNNAGVGLFGNFSDIKWQDHETMINLNIKALTFLTNFYLPLMIKNNKGRILNIASTAAFQPGPKMAVYFATKAYVLSLGDAIAEEIKKSNVSITTLCPGPTRTDFFNHAKMSHTKMGNKKNSMMMESRDVAEMGFKAMMNSKRIKIAGLINQLGVFSTHLLPRNTLTKITAQFINQKSKP